MSRQNLFIFAVGWWISDTHCKHTHKLTHSHSRSLSLSWTLVLVLALVLVFILVWHTYTCAISWKLPIRSFKWFVIVRLCYFMRIQCTHNTPMLLPLSEIFKHGTKLICAVSFLFFSNVRAYIYIFATTLRIQNCPFKCFWHLMNLTISAWNIWLWRIFWPGILSHLIFVWHREIIS